MINLKKIKLPDSVEVDGSFYLIKTDFRTWLGFADLLSESSITYFDLMGFFIERCPQNMEKAFLKLREFYAPPQELPRPSSKDSSEIILDYNIDSDLIYSAFLEQYKIDLLATDKNGKAIYNFHWHQFLALMNGLHNTKLNEIMSYRCYNPQDKTKYEESMKQLKRAWALPQKHEISAEQKEFEELLAGKK